MRVSLLSSWDDRCGIAAYSADLVGALRGEGVAVEVTPAFFGPAPRLAYQAMGQSLNGMDIAHIQHSYAFYGGMNPLRSGWGAVLGAIRVPALITVHELDDAATGLFGLPAGIERAMKAVINRRTFLHPSLRRWVVHAGSLGDSLAALGAPADHIRYRPLPVPPPPTGPVDSAPLRRELGLGERQVLVIPGFLSRRKGYEVALGALQRLPKEVMLVAAGGEHAADRTDSAAALVAEAARMGLADRFRVTGYLSPERMEQAIGMAALCLAPFTSVSASASVRFCLARGQAVVASRIGDLAELPCVRHVAPGDSAALAEAVSSLLGRPESVALLQEASRRYARENDVRSLARWTIELYREIEEEKGTCR